MALGVDRRNMVMVGVLLAGTLLAVLNQTLLSPALPAIMADLGVDATTVQWLTSGYSLVEAVIIPLSAYLIGRFSTRQLFISAFVIFAIGSLAATLAPNFYVLLLGRVLQAVCTGMSMPMVFTVILLVFPREKRGTAMGVIGLIIGFAPAIGPSLAGLLVDTVGWRALFAITTALSVVVIILSIFVLRNYGDFKRTTFDKLSVVLSTVGLVCLLYGLSTFSSSQNLFVTAALIVVGLVVLALYVRRQLTLPSPMLKVDILKTRKYATAVIIIVIVQAALMGTGVITPLYIQGVRGYSATMSGVAMLPGAVIGAFMGLLAGRLFDRFGVRRVVIPGAIVALLGGIGLVLLGIDTDFVFIALAYTVLTMGLQFTMTPLNTWGVNSLDNSVIQHAQGLSNTLNQVAASLGTAVLVSISALAPYMVPEASPLEQAYVGNHLAFSTTCALMVVAVLVILFFVRDVKKDKKAVAGSDAQRISDSLRAQADGAVAAGSVVTQADDPYSEICAKDAMTCNPVFALEDAAMRDVIRTMAANDTSGLPLVNAAGDLAGFISDGDIASYLGKNEISFFDTSMNLYRFIDSEAMKQRLFDLLELKAADIATKRVISVEEDTPIDEVCRVLAERRIKKVPVVKDGRLVGTISRRNIVRSISEVIEDLG
ncbi:DHA2 family efflux MFS transporter permease subunit [Adlercreutzia sp. ZJ304]|uniref:DHA2 family efflux MFS transporter permease subunit n=1 Tax=Adlercreutzia sp. ZJ304 TaxID=2709791 RepID=UPI0013EB3419|nr:DHA2 family efflux MFS transporter permease subunit [Adlercreutzia sp. ZJ304]